MKKAMKYPSLCSKKYSQGDLINYNQVDSERMNNSIFYLSYVIFCPIQIIVGLSLLYIITGPSMLVGIAVLIILFVINLLAGWF